MCADECRMTNDEWKNKPLRATAPGNLQLLVIRRCSLVIAALAFSGPFPASAIGQEPPAAPPAEAPEPDIISNPAVRAALELPRTKPSDYVRAILVLVDLGEAQRAVPIMEQLSTLQITDDQRVELVEELGSAAMLRFARIEALGPPAKEFADASMAAADRAATSRERLGQLVQQLGDASPDTRRAAAVELTTTGIAGVKYLIGALADAEDPSQRAGLRQALVGLAPLSVPPLIAVLDASDDDMKADAIAVLAEVGGGDVATLLAVPALMEPVDSAVGRSAQKAFLRLTREHVTPELAERMLRRGIENYLAGSPPFRPDEDGLIEVWLPTTDGRQFGSVRLSTGDAALLRAARLARDLARLRPGDSDAERQAVLLALEANWLLGAGEPTDLSAFDPLQLNRALADSLANKRYGAAMTLATELGRRGDAAVFFTADGKPSPLAAALDSPHPQVRYAALAAIMQIDSKSPFPGSSRVAEVLNRIARSTGAQRAVVAMPPLERAATLAGQLAAQQVHAAPVELGRDAVEQATQSPDVEMVLVDMAIDRPDVREVLFQLRRTPATALVPIGLLAPAGQLADAEQIAAEHWSVIAFSRPDTLAANAAIIGKLELTLPRGWPTPEQRLEQAAQALEWIDRLLSDGRTFYNLRGRPESIETALTASAIPTQANLQTLAKVGTAASQRMLLNYVNQSVLPMETRQQAAAAFASAVERRGVLLTTEEIRRQYDRYNASETADAATQQLLGGVLDTIEKKSGQRAKGSNSSGGTP
jgi:hypothetical protein